jgi:protocatechuate 3,4-dioxygenase beta subunit
LIRLRADLDRAHGGDGRSWLLALFPIAREPGGLWAAAIGAFVMDAKLKIGIAVVAIAGLLSTIALWPTSTEPAAQTSLAAASAPELGESPATEPTGEPLQSGPAGGDQRASVGAPVPEAIPTAPAPERAKLRGRVIDVERAPVANVSVRYLFAAAESGEVVEAKTDSDGRFELPDPETAGKVDVVTAGWTSLLRPEFAMTTDEREIVIVVARSITLGGVVVDAERRPVESATVAVPLPYGMRSRFDSILEGSNTVERSAKTDPLGRFELAGVPVFAGAVLSTSHPMHLEHELALPEHDDLALEIVLTAASSTRTRVIGKVVDTDGNAVEGARVALGDGSTKSGPGGMFALDAADGSDPKSAKTSHPRRICALHPGHLPAVLELEPGASWPDPLVLRLGTPPLAIEGRVVDATGAPIKSAQVWTSDETHFGYIEIEGGEMAVRAGSTIEGLLRGDPFTPRMRTSAAGRFELGGLLARDYRVHVLDPKRMTATTVTLAAGTRNVEIRMPAEDLHERITGRVTNLSGEPIAGAWVKLVRDNPAENASELDRFESAAAKTDAEGRFAFERVSKSVLALRVEGEGMALEGFEHTIRPGDDLLHVEIAAPLRVHVQVDASNHPSADEVAVLDAGGEKLELAIRHGNSAYGMREVRLIEGRSEIFSVLETAKTLVLYANDAEVLRQPVKLASGSLNTLRP